MRATAYILRTCMYFVACDSDGRFPGWTPDMRLITHFTIVFIPPSDKLLLLVEGIHQHRRVMYTSDTQATSRRAIT